MFLFPCVYVFVLYAQHSFHFFKRNIRTEWILKNNWYENLIYRMKAMWSEMKNEVNVSTFFATGYLSLTFFFSRKTFAWNNLHCWIQIFWEETWCSFDFMWILSTSKCNGQMKLNPLNSIVGFYSQLSVWPPFQYYLIYKDVIIIQTKVWL